MSDNGDEHALENEKLPQNHHMKIPWNRISDDEDIPAMDATVKLSRRWSVGSAFKCCRAGRGPGECARP